MDEVQIDIYSSTGMLVQSEFHNPRNGSLVINTSSLPGGVYTADLRTKENRTMIRIIKQ